LDIMFPHGKPGMRYNFSLAVHLLEMNFKFSIRYATIYLPSRVDSWIGCKEFLSMMCSTCSISWAD
jgi:hypothetical protein